jgi:hypothetical protein
MNLNRYFEVIINGNFLFPAYTLEVNNDKIATKKAIKEAKSNKNTRVDIIEVDNNGDMIDDGFCKTILL